MRLFLIFLTLFACPKSSESLNTEEKERRAKLQELMQEEEFDDIPENGADTGELE